jgi:H+-translocating NAD(P) transhydrogenase subunit alpha
MSQELSLVSRQAASLSEQTLEIAEKLRILAEAPITQVTVGVDPFIFAITIFTLACFVGYYVVWKVTPSLHTPLMSITNAISGIIIIGALIAASSAMFNISTVLGFIAAFFASINIFGGFIVTERMLGMFRKK